LESRGVRIWFSEKDVGLGVPLLRAIDKGLANSKVGIVLVTPALLRRLPTEGIADKELSALLARERLVPVVHGTTYEALREVSPLLASRSGLSTVENSMASVAARLAERNQTVNRGITKHCKRPSGRNGPCDSNAASRPAGS